MKASRIIQSKEVENKVVHSLSCGHSITEAARTYRSYYNDYFRLGIYRRELKCPQCVGFRNK